MCLMTWNGLQRHMWHHLLSLLGHNWQYLWMVLEDLFLRLHFFYPSTHIFYPSTTVFTCPNDGWTGLYINLWILSYALRTWRLTLAFLPLMLVLHFYFSSLAVLIMLAVSLVSSAKPLPFSSVMRPCFGMYFMSIYSISIYFSRLI